MEKHEQKYCPKCQASFICKTGAIAHCQCNEVQLSAATKRFMAATYYDCLCKSCLQKIETLVQQSLPYQFPRQKEMLQEGLHYYREGNNFVFTELYHLLRGHCCNNGCRHCVYGYKRG